MRIIALYSPIVTMLQTVIYDLRIFLLFYGILVVLFSLTMGVLGTGNPHPDINMNLALAKAEAIYFGDSYLGIEYLDIHRIVGNLIDTLKLSLGDFGSVIDGSSDLNREDNWIFWIVFMMVFILTCVIFLNFIIAEASASYEKVSGDI